MAAGGNVVDLCFVMDCTGSMSNYITACKDDISSTVQTIVDEHPDACINLGFVAYRDHCDGDKRIEKFAFNPSVADFQAFVGALAATGGGDYPEDVLGGLWESANMTWSAPTRVLFHIFDAPPHGRPKYHNSPSESYPDGHPADQNVSDIFARLRDNYVDYYMMKLTNTLDKMVSVFTAEARAVDYNNIEERLGVSDVSKVMDDVAMAVLSSMAVRMSSRHREGLRAEAILPPRVMPNLYKVYCGIDFGTHGSAYAFCTPDDPVPRAANNWGGAGVDVKTLTNLLLGPDRKCVPDGHGFGHAALEYFLELESAEQLSHFFFRRFKMALYDDAIVDADRDDEKGVDIHGQIRAKNGQFLRSETVLVEALRFMIDHVMTQISARYGVDDPGDVQWILTVPAIWSQRSRRIMESAAYKAGVPRGKYDQLIVALEPECAAVVALDTLGLSPEDCYMMIDCGGGTVDIACHEMVSKTEVKEIHPASGGPWGGTYIDDEFMEMLRIVFGDDVMEAIDEEMKSDSPGLVESIIKNFNSAKAAVLPTEDKRNVNLQMLKPLLREVIGQVAQINERLSASNYRGVVGGVSYNRRGMLSVSRDVWDLLFGKVIDPLIDHIHMLLAKEELNSKIRTLCVVGGFAESPVLMDRLRAAFGDTRAVVRPPNPILTVVKGAARFGLVPTTIAERCAPKTIGIAIRDSWNPATDPEEKRTFVRGEGYVVDNVFFKFIQAGQPIPRDMPPVVHYFEPVNLERFQIAIFRHDDPDPRFVPERPCGVIGPVEFPPGFDHNKYDICVQLDFSGRMVSVKVQFGEEEPISAPIEWE